MLRNYCCTNKFFTVLSSRNLSLSCLSLLHFASSSSSCTSTQPSFSSDICGISVSPNLSKKIMV
ncbi:hypothetical protein PUN28_012301 [Cardiocondyla obscurior]|uniref:Secreted protein n=1 Tax=Cardiocondyla obscurior TaxID=286306 RepID=A0AAW2FBR7_9HYME